VRPPPATRSALDADGDLLAPEERARIDAAMATVQRLIAGQDRHALSAAVVALNVATEDFAARRMDRSVVGVLAGRSVDSLAED
jgi:molecular chaperone HscA